MNFLIDLNCDVGEGLNNEADIMPFISSCSIACGAHAGDESTIVETIKLAVKHGVKVGAHPSYPDKENFGRKIMQMDLTDLQNTIEKQIIRVYKQVKQLGTSLHHVKAHGALYNKAAIDPDIARVIIDAIKNTAIDAVIYVPYNSVLQKFALKANMKIKVEAFADRNYNEDLTLVSRKNDNAIITEPDLILAHLQKMIIEKKVCTLSGVEVKLMADTFCVHGDNPNAIALLKFLSEKLPEKGIKIE